MALAHSPKTVTDGLVFYYDQGNIQKSWKGAPATNLWTETNLNNWTKTATVSTSNYSTPFDTPSYVITDSTSSYLNVSRSITVPNDSSSYTISLFVRKTYGATSARLGFNTGINGGTAVGGNYRLNSDTGVANGGVVLDYGDWWYWYVTIANNSTGNTNLYYNFYPATGFYNGSDDATATGTAIVGAFMLVAGSTAVRFAEGTRSNTQAVLDLTGQNTITATSLTYNSNGSFSFDGSSNYMDVSGSGFVSNLSAYSVCFWAKRTTGNKMPVSAASGITFYWYGDNSWRYTHGGTSGEYYYSKSVTIADNTWGFFCCTYDGSYVKIYRNGVYEGQQATTGSADWSVGMRIGYWNGGSGYQWSGNIDAVSFYNIALTSDQVLQNFNALRGRYGI